MSLCSNCNESLFSHRIPDSSLILEKLRWESGPASIPDTEELLPILQSTQQELQDCEKQIKTLESRRQSLQKYVDYLQALLSPFRKVPDEILRRIFDDCCDVTHFVVDNVVRDIPALALSSVCSRWRRNALSMPGIWSKISLICEKLGVGYDDEGLVSTLDIFLNRSLEHPLIVTIELPYGFNSRHPVLTLLMNHTHRWRSFTNRSKAYTLSRLLSHHDQAPASPSFPLLEELITTEVGKDELKIVARTAPKLKKWGITLIPTADSPQVTSLFVQLSRLEFYYPYGYEIEALINPSHRLVSLKTEESLEIDDAEGSPTVCHTIHTLTLCHHPMRSSRRKHSVLPYLTLPSLKAIHLERTPKVYLIQMMHTESVRQGDWASFEPFMALLSRSACPLTTLSIQSLALADLKLVDLLTHLPTLLNLSIDDTYVAPGFSPVTGRFIENLQVHRTSYNDPIVPRLHSLKLDIGASTFNDASVVDMIRSRWIPSKMHTAGESGVDCLREFTIRFRNREEIPRVYQPLEDMERNGLRAVVLWQTKGSESKD